MAKGRNLLWHQAMLYLVLTLLCILPFWSCGKKPKDSKKVEQPNFAARTFNSKVQCKVWVRETLQSELRFIGSTPSDTPLEIPTCWVWGIEQELVLGDKNYWDLLVQEIEKKKIPGLKVFFITETKKYLAGMTGLKALLLDGTAVRDEDLEYIERLTGLQWLDLSNNPITDEGLQHLRGLAELQVLNLQYTQYIKHFYTISQYGPKGLTNSLITGVGLKYLEHLDRLQTLDLGGTKIEDEELKYLEHLTGLKRLDLSNTDITGIGLKHLKGLTELQELNLSYTFITDAGLEHLRGMSRLQELDLINTHITDAGLEHLKGLTKLQRLYLWRTEVTEAGVKQLQQSHPKIEDTRYPLKLK